MGLSSRMGWLSVTSNLVLILPESAEMSRILTYSNFVELKLEFPTV
jgi:hypothetical protein